MNTEKTDFLKYEKLRQTGLYNMITEANWAMAAMGWNYDLKEDRDRYFGIIENYTELKNKYNI